MDEKESIERSTQANIQQITEIQSQIQKESEDFEIQCEIIKDSTEIFTQTDEMTDEKVVRETKVRYSHISLIHTNLSGNTIR